MGELGHQKQCVLYIAFHFDGAYIFILCTQCTCTRFFLFVLDRRQPKNMLLAGLWCSTQKPNMQVLLKPVVESLIVLETEGWYNNYLMV